MFRDVDVHIGSGASFCAPLEDIRNLPDMFVDPYCNSESARVSRAKNVRMF